MMENTTMRYIVKGKALMKAGAESFPIGATVDASNSKEAMRKAVRRFGEEWSGSGYAIEIDLVHLKNGGRQ